MSFTILIAFSVALFIGVAAYNSSKGGDIVIAFTKGWMFGFVYDSEVEDEVKYHTFQVCVGFVILNYTFETDGQV